MSLTNEQRQARFGRMTATRIAAVVGHSRFSNALKVYEEMREFGSDDFPSDPKALVKNRMWLGTLYEDDAIQCLAARFPHLTTHHLQMTWTAPRETPIPFSLMPIPWDWAAASPDALVYSHTGRLIAGAEAKTVFKYDADDWGAEYTDEVRSDYLIQCQWGMAVMGLKWWWLVALIFGEPRFYLIRRDDVLIRKLWAHGFNFMLKHVWPSIPPVENAQAAILPVARQVYIEADAKAAKHAKRYLSIWNRQKKAKDLIETLEPKRAEIASAIIAAAGDSKGLLYQDHKLAVIRKKSGAHVTVYPPKEKNENE